VNYLPQLILAATLTPATLLVVLSFDWLSAVIITVTIPLVPLFMILVGKLTQGRSERGLVAMERLGSQVLDLIAGLPTLRALGRQSGPVRRVQELGNAHRQATMGTLRIAFLSGMVLELLTTISVALVAVTIGFRLVYGDVDLVTALTVLILAPEVFNPLRAVGTQYHASTDGVAAAEAAFTVLETPVQEPGRTPCPDLRHARVRLVGVGVRSAGGWTPLGLDLELAPGTVTALVGPSGIGKSTAVEVTLGLLTPDRGEVRVEPEVGDNLDLASIEPRTYWDQVSWLPQRPFLEPGTVHQLVGDVDPQVRDRAAHLTGLDEVVAGLPNGWQTELGTGGAGLSVGQRQRVALTRALIAPAPLVVLDEPTAHLDAAGEQVVLDTVAALRDAGSAVLLVAHRVSLVRTADHVVQVLAGPDDDPAPTAHRDLDPAELV
jgi:ATP-binding cassette subfamily C protein CydD